MDLVANLDSPSAKPYSYNADYYIDGERGKNVDTKGKGGTCDGAGDALYEVYGENIVTVDDGLREGNIPPWVQPNTARTLGAILQATGGKVHIFGIGQMHTCKTHARFFRGFLCALGTTRKGERIRSVPAISFCYGKYTSLNSFWCRGIARPLILVVLFLYFSLHEHLLDPAFSCTGR